MSIKHGQIFHTIIIGAGVAGLFTAQQLAKKIGKGNVLLLEKKQRTGRKLLLTGAGQCNLTNTAPIEEFLTRYGKQGRFLKHALYAFPPSKVIDFFEAGGVTFYIDRNGKYFPESGRANTILDFLMEQCRRSGVVIQCDSAVQSVSHKDNSFSLIAQGRPYSCKNLIITTGGKSYPATGSSGDGYSFAKTLGHSIVAPTESLTPVVVKYYRFKQVAGVAFRGVSVSLKGRKENTYGDILFTHTGLSGPAVLHHSRYVVPGDTLLVNFFPAYNYEEVEERVATVLADAPKQSVKNALRSFPLPSQFLQQFIEAISVDPDKKSNAISKKEIRRIAEHLYRFPFEVKAKGDNTIAMATAGGVSTKEINSKTCESKVVPHLYFAGEVVDVDGDSGGYNIQAALSMGYLVGKAISDESDEVVE